VLVHEQDVPQTTVSRTALWPSQIEEQAPDPQMRSPIWHVDAPLQLTLHGASLGQLKAAN
jgi:hypothetical protein